MSPIQFYKPKELQKSNLSSSQENMPMVFRTIKGVYLSGAAIHFFYGGIQFASYTIGSGLAIQGTNQEGASKELIATFQGSHFQDYVGKIIEARCCGFFTENEVEMVFPISIV